MFLLTRKHATQKHSMQCHFYSLEKLLVYISTTPVKVTHFKFESLSPLITNMAVIIIKPKLGSF